jgi:hypothetical protein
MSGRVARLLAALVGLGMLVAAKPLPPAEGPAETAAQARESWRGQGVSACIGELRAVPGLGPEDLESICGCAVNRQLRMVGDGPMPSVDPQTFRRAMRGFMISCTSQLRPERVSDVARLSMAATAPPAPVTEPPPADGKPAGDEETVVQAESDGAGESSGGGLWGWLSTLSWPAWLTGASVLWWIAIGIFVLGLLILRFRGRDPRNDLAAPPSHMRRGAPPQPPRRPDLPR